ncbi:MAG TPA: TIGR03808 family TAT-translocated repetitive protein [Methyloceanibacter sp.]|nr:TIGR03808 family TAT-translocated repetitive protein [Methyloceanibacter sp.]
MAVGRREVLLGGVGLGLAMAAGPRAGRSQDSGLLQACSTQGLVPGGGAIDQTAALQAAANAAAETGMPMFLPAGIYSTSKLTLRSGTRIEGVPGETILRYRDGGALLALERVENVRLSGLVLDGDAKPLGEQGSLLAATDTKHLDVTNCRVIGSVANGIALSKVSGWIKDCEIGDIGEAGLISEDASGLEIAHNHVRDCGGNGIVVLRSEPGEDATIVSANRIERIAAKSGGGQSGNGINVVRAGAVVINGNRIADCASSAVRANAASNCQMIGNACARMGDVALYAEFSVDGTVIANNLIDKATAGISVANFAKGGRLAVIQGNLIRNLFLRKDNEVRGFGIGVEADAVVTGNVIEGAPAYGIMIGWGPYLRDVSVTDNLIRDVLIGIGVSVDPSAGIALITKNLIAGAKEGAIHAMSGPASIGPDLARESADAFGNVAVYANVAR